MVEDDYRDGSTQKRGEPAEQQGKVVAGSSEDGVDAVDRHSFRLQAITRNFLMLSRVYPVPGCRAMRDGEPLVST